MGLSFCPVYAVGVNDWLTVVLAIGLAVRITRLVTLDTITQPIRDRLSGPLSVLAECPWCAGFWISVGVGLSWWAWADQTWWQVGALIATLAWLCGALAGAGMPKQMEIATVSPVAIVNADEPMTDNIEFNVTTDTVITDSEVEAAIARVLKRQAGEGR